MKLLLMAAIRERRLIHLVYENQPKTLAPYVLGTDETGKDVLLCRQVSPWMVRKYSWKVLKLQRICGLLALEERIAEKEETIDPPEELLAGHRFDFGFLDQEEVHERGS